MLLKHALTELLLVKDYTPKTARRRSEVLADFIEWAATQDITEVEQVSKDAARRYLAYLRERPNKRTGTRLSSETQHGQASVLRMFLRFCVDEDWLSEDVVKRFHMPRHAQKVIQVLDSDHYARLIHATDSCPWLALRDRAIVAVLFDTGIRAEELCTLRLEHISLASREAFIRVDGKGRKQREIGLGRQATIALHRYLVDSRCHVESNLVFLNRANLPLTPNAIDRMLYRLRDAAGRHHFDGIRVSAHTFRHSYAIHFMQQGGDIYKLSRLLGHETVSTTERYLRAFRARDARLTSKSVLDNL